MAGEILGYRTDKTPIYAGAETLSFVVDQMPPGIRIYVYCNGVELTEFCGPLSETARTGDPIITDQQGRAVGLVFIPSTAGKYKFPVGEITLTFADAAGGIKNAKYFSEAILYNHGVALGDLEQGTTVSLRKTEKIRSSAEGSSADEADAPANTNRLNPLAQSFIVDETNFPLGVMVTGLILYIYKKDDLLPIGVEIRPMENGKPSKTEYLAGTHVTLLPSEVKIPENDKVQATFFRFEYPIFLKPNEYAFCVMTKSDKYEVLTAKLGDGKTVKQPYAGTLFKPQNTGEWTGDSNEDLTFVLVKAKFKTDQPAIFEMQSPRLPDLEYTKLRLLSTEIGFGTTAFANYKIQTTNAGSRIKTDYQDILPYGEPVIRGRQTVKEEGDIKVEVTLTTKSEDVAPILDRQLMKALAFRTLIKPYSPDISDTELTPNEGEANSRYVSRIVTLQEGYESQGIQVTLDVNRKLGTDIEVFARVLSKDDKTLTNGIDEQYWVRVPLVQPAQKSYAGLDDEQFFTETYKLLYPFLEYKRDVYNQVTGNTDVVAFSDFTFYQVKVVFYAANPSIIPKIKNLIATSIL
jgi:hypothetical protein